MRFHIRMIYKSGRAVNVPFEADSLNDANDYWYRTCLKLSEQADRWKSIPSDDMMLARVELKEGRFRPAFWNFENGRVM